MVDEAELNKYLEDTAAALDIPEEMAEEAILEYEKVGVWLGEEDSDLHDDEPQIFAQGSFRLGTAVRPIQAGAEFDIDLVCRLALHKEQITQKELKRRIGSRLKEHEELAAQLKERRRCWTLTYPKKFHLDVLPAIPDSEVGSDTILLTDKDLIRWQHSNPIGYADWFFDRMRQVLQERRAIFAKAAGVEVEDVPIWRVRTPLQRAVQLLKRHRDIRFKADDECRPVSIIITTLAALSYQQQRDVYSTLLNVIRLMPTRIEKRNGKWLVFNPTHPDENFADKWNENPERADAFFRWLRLAEQDLRTAVPLTESGAAITIAKNFGAGAGLPALRAATVPSLADSRHTQPLKWPFGQSGRCRVRGWVFPGLRKGKRLWELTDRSVPKGLGLRFEATTNVAPPFEVHWQVVNTGREAADVNDLRGGFERSEDGTSNVRWERTAYAGTHWVEAFIVKNGVCVARSSRKLVRIRG
jgi:hypothetical protein